MVGRPVVDPGIVVPPGVEDVEIGREERIRRELGEGHDAVVVGIPELQVGRALGEAGRITHRPAQQLVDEGVELGDEDVGDHSPAAQGAKVLRTPVSRYVFHLRRSYHDEAELQVDELVDRMKLRRIGILYQDDSYGLAVGSGILKALKRRGLEPVAEGTHRRSTEDVDAALAARGRRGPTP